MELVTLLTPKHTSCQLGSLTEWVSSPSYKVALVAAMHKLLLILNAMLKTKTVWRPSCPAA